MVGQTLAALVGAKLGFLGEAANSVGGYLAQAIPGTGLNAKQMLQDPLKAYVLLGLEPELDSYDGAQARAAMQQAEFVVALSPYQHQALDYAHVLLPIAPFTETSGTFVSTEGRVQSFNGVVLPLADTRPAWKVLRVLGNLAALPGFDYDSSEAVRVDALGDGSLAHRLNNHLRACPASGTSVAVGVMQRIGEIAPYQADALVRRADALQKSAVGLAPVAAMNEHELSRLALQDGDLVKVSQASGAATLRVKRDNKLPDHCVRIHAGHVATATLGGLMDGVSLERVAIEQKVVL